MDFVPVDFQILPDWGTTLIKIRIWMHVKYYQPWHTVNVQLSIYGTEVNLSTECKAVV